MAISEDLRGIRMTLGELASGNEALVGLLCDNLASLADQVEALEELPFSPCGPSLGLLGTGAEGSSGRHQGGLLQ